MLLASVICAAIAGLLAMLAMLGYVFALPDLIRVSIGLEGMSPLTSAAILGLAAAVAASTRNRPRLMLAGTVLAILAAGASIIARLANGRETASLWVGTRLFHLQSGAIGQTSIATALCVLLVAAALLLRRNAALADWAAGAALVISGIALLGYFYGVEELYKLPMFNNMALNTAFALLLLSVATLLAEPTRGWASVIGSAAPGGGATRRQLSFVALPIFAAKLLLLATAALQVGPAVAMALLVTVTILPLAVLILRDGRVLNALDRERRDKIRLQNDMTTEMADRLARQADELARQSDERARAEAALNRTQRLEVVGQLTGGIAHDFNNLLTSIRGNLELLQKRLPEGDERLRRYVDNAAAATSKGAKVTAQLLAFSRSQHMDVRAVELDPVLTSARELIGNALGPNITLELHLDTRDVWVSTDPDQLELAILNLAVNARDAMPGGGQIRLESALQAAPLAVPGEAETHAVIRVTDTGVGMTEQVASQAVEPFFTTKERGKGTGLGLAQVYGFVRQCGGDLRIVSAPGRGTCVEMMFRCTAPVHSAPTPVTSEATPDDEAARGRQVLVIDDDDGVRVVIADALAAAGFQVIQAADGQSGLAALAQSNAVAAVIDFLMPGLNGAEVARLAQQQRPGLPIVFVSGYSDTMALDGITGAVVLRKPFEVEALRRALQSVLHGRSAQDGQPSS